MGTYNLKFLYKEDSWWNIESRTEALKIVDRFNNPQLIRSPWANPLYLKHADVIRALFLIGRLICLIRVWFSNASQNKHRKETPERD